MRGYFGLGQLSAAEKSDILNQHKSVYNGYQTMQPQVSNTQPLTVYDFAGDKDGMVVNNKGEVKKYTNMGINEQVELKEVCDECGAMMTEGVCNECNYGHMEEGNLPDEKDLEKFRPSIDLGKSFEKMKKKDMEPKGIESFFANKLKSKKDKIEEQSEMCECGGEMREGVCNECGYGSMDEETGHLDDIYNVRDLNLKNGEFDYVEGGGNDYGTFEGMHKNMYKEDESDEFVNYDDNFEDPDNEDDGFEDLELSDLDEQIATDKLEKGKKYKYKTSSFEDELEFEDEFTDKDVKDKMFKFKGKDSMSHLMGKKHIEDFMRDIDEQGGNADDMDTDDVEPAYNFDSDGPMAGGDVYPVNEFETMESAWDEELDEVDVSGVQGVYGDMKPAYDFDSEGPGKAGPYQEFSYESEDEDAYWDKDLEDGELDFDLEKFNPEDKSWEEIKAHTGDWDEIDEDLQESFHNQKTKIMEMFSRFKKYN